MSKQLRPKYLSREEVIETILECAKKLGHVPTQAEVLKTSRVRCVDVHKTFGTFTQALRIAGLERHRGPRRVHMQALFQDWCEVAHAVKRIPTGPDYILHGKYSLRPFYSRFGAWAKVAGGMHGYANVNGLAEKHASLLAMVAEHQSEHETTRKGTVKRDANGIPMGTKLKLQRDRPVYGAPLQLPGLAHEPVNEAGVVYLFGVVAIRMGFVVTRIQTEFPDCEAVRELEPGKWQRLRIEFEFQSRNFVIHGHDANECDMIVCWLHNWADCPEHIEVLELGSVVKRLK